MKRAIIFLIVIISILTTTCKFSPAYDQEENYLSEGTIQIILPSGGGEISQFNIFGTTADGRSFYGEASSETVVFTQSNLIAGIWTVKVDAIDSTGQIILSGISSILVQSDVSVEVEIVLKSLSGAGTLSLRIEWPPETLFSPSITSLLETSDGPSLNDIVFSLDIENCVAEYNGIWPSGFYTLSMSLFENTLPIWGHAEALQISEGTVTSKTITLYADDLNLLIVADHNAVEKFDEIPVEWLSEARKYLISLVGLSHNRGPLYGFMHLNTLDPIKYPAEVSFYSDEIPPSPLETKLQIIRPFWDETNTWRDITNMDRLWSTQDGVNLAIAHIQKLKDIGIKPDIFGWSWCWDNWRGVASDNDPSINASWYGRTYVLGDETDYGPWAIDDRLISGLNSKGLSMNTYLNAWEIIQAAHPDVLVIYATAPNDSLSRQQGFQAWLKNNYIREQVIQRNGILFDYADILSYGPAGEQTLYWSPDNTVQFPGVYEPYCTDAYDSFGDGTSHLHPDAEIRLGKAFWWLLARMAGWNGI